MHVVVKNYQDLDNNIEVNLLIREVEAELPEELKAFQAELTKEDKVGIRTLRMAEGDLLKELVVLSLEKKNCDVYKIQKEFDGLMSALKALKKDEISGIIGKEVCDEKYVQFVRTLMLLDNKFDQHIKTGYKNILEKEDDEEDKKSPELTLYLSADEVDTIQHEAESLAKATAAARELVNQPANVVTPTVLAERAVELGKECGFEVEVKGAKEIQELGMHAYWAVAKGSDEEPQFIIMHYKNNPKSDKTLALVGKGLCYDSGGYDIKPGEGMRTMNCDMGGSAAVIGAMSALAREKAEVNVVALVAACENMISGHAYRNGDIIDSLAGKSIEIMSTDAEGRLTLADAVTYAWKHEKVDAIADIATLTGAVVRALSTLYTGVISDNEQLWNMLEDASQSCGDLVWRFPIHEDYEAKNESFRADICNSGKGGAGSITAGLFVRAFANQVPFIHLDIAGTAYDEAGSKRAPKGASGVGAEMLYYFAKNYFSDAFQEE